MTQMVTSVVDIFNSRMNPLTQSDTFSVSSTGTYYIGLHASSGYKRYGIYVLSVFMDEERKISTPGAVTDFAAVADINGALSAQISLKVPALTINGSPLTGTLTVDVYRDNEKIKSFPAATPGEQLEFTDNASAGLHNYRAVASNADGEGISAEASAYFGFDLPKAPEVVNVKETETPGRVLVTWPAVTEDVNGKILPEGEVTYKLYGPGGVVVVQGLRDTQYTAKATSGTQVFANYGVTAITSKGEGEEFCISEIIPVGNAYQLPWNEPFSGGEFSSLFRYDDFDRYMRFNIYSSEDTELEDADGSGYYLIGRGYDPGEHARIYTGKMSLAGASYPALTFSYFQIPGTQNYMDVYVYDGEQWTKEKSIILSGEESDWADAYVDLSKYIGKTVQLSFDCYVMTHYSIALDNFLLSDRPAIELAVKSFNAPESLKIGTEGVFDVMVENKGGVATDVFSVALFRNDEKVAESAAQTPLAPGDKVRFGFTDILSVTAADVNLYDVRILAEGDADESNNISTSKEVVSIQPVYPYVDSLTGRAEESQVHLAWDEPSLETMVFEPITESFETWTDFGINQEGEWSFIDGDGSRTFYLEDFEFPNQGSAMAAMTLPSAFFSGWNNFDAHSGGKLLASFSAVNGPNDDWIISPLLIGDEQTVSFYAKSMSSVYPDSFEFYYSTEGNDRMDFIQMGEAQTAPHDWALYTYELPEGATYFAVRYISADGFVFMLDDFSFIPASARNLMEELSLVGYNVYRNNARINTEPVEEPEYVDMSAPAGINVYKVTALYTQGESRLGNPVELEIEGSGVDFVKADNGAAEYYNLQGIRVDNPVSGEIYIVRKGANDSTPQLMRKNR